MKKIILIILILLTPVNVFAISTSARGAVVLEQSTNRIIYEQNKDNPMLIASITKIMTAILAIESNKLKQIVQIDEKVLKAYGSAIYITVGEKISLEDLVYGLMLRSGNDAAIVIANIVSNNEEAFVALMNQKAKEINMKNTIFQNPHGLDQKTENYSTAYDMALLTNYVMNNEIYRKIVATNKHIVKTNQKTYVWYNKNKLLTSYEYTTGGKTGYTKRAKRTLVTTAKKDDLELTIVTLNDGNDWSDHKSLYQYFFNNYKQYKIIDNDYFNQNSSINNESFYINESFSYPLQIKERKKIKILISKPKIKEYKEDKPVGSIKVYLNNKELHRQSVYIKIEEKEKNFFQKILGWFNDQ